MSAKTQLSGMELEWAVAAGGGGGGGGGGLAVTRSFS